jgi:hypothetical protein
MLLSRTTRAMMTRAATALEASTSCASTTGRRRVDDVGGIAVSALQRLDLYEVVGSAPQQRRWKSAAAAAAPATATASPATAVVDRFDSHSLVKELRNCAFTEPQSEGIVKV